MLSFNFRRLVFPLALITFVLAACAPAAAPPDDAVSFSGEVLPIFEQHCGECHIDEVSGGLSLANYEGVTTTGNHAPVVDPGNEVGSFLLVILRSDAMTVEHESAALSEAELQTITLWVEQGALDN